MENTVLGLSNLGKGVKSPGSVNEAGGIPDKCVVGTCDVAITSILADEGVFVTHCIATSGPCTNKCIGSAVIANTSLVTDKGVMVAARKMFYRGEQRVHSTRQLYTRI